MNREPLAPRERRAVDEFVSRGGGLLVIGDHTDLEGTSSAMNPTLATVGARLRFDTVWRRPDAVVPDVAFLPHALTVGIGRVHFSTGCSIDLHGGALIPLVVAGPALFSDGGDRKGDAFLGDGTHGPDEPVGDLVLAAAGTHGLGRVVVLGDSAWLQNSVVGVNRQFAARLLWWLSRSEPSAELRVPARLFALALVVVWLLAISLDGGRSPSFAGHVTVAIALTFLAGAVVAARLAARTDCPLLPSSSSGTRVVVDLAHANRSAFFFSRGARADDRDSMDVWLREMEARGCDVRLHGPGQGPLTDRSVEGCGLLVVVHPRVRFDPEEIDSVRRFVEQSGSLLLLVGPGADGGRADLLPALGLQADPLPVGLAAPQLYAGRFPLKVDYGDGPYPPAPIDREAGVTKERELVPVDPVQVRGGRPFATAFGRAVGVTLRRGRGRIVLLGDREHFTDFAFSDGKGGIDAARVRFLHDLLLHVTGRVP
jgi:hypothetical protein